MIKANELRKFLEAINEDTEICVSVEDEAPDMYAKVVEVIYNSEDNILMIVGEGA